MSPSGKSFTIDELKSRCDEDTQLQMDALTYEYLDPVCRMDEVQRKLGLVVEGEELLVPYLRIQEEALHFVTHHLPGVNPYYRWTDRQETNARGTFTTYENDGHIVVPLKNGTKLHYLTEAGERRMQQKEAGEAGPSQESAEFLSARFHKRGVTEKVLEGLVTASEGAKRNLNTTVRRECTAALVEQQAMQDLERTTAATALSRSPGALWRPTREDRSSRGMDGTFRNPFRRTSPGPR